MTKFSKKLADFGKCQRYSTVNKVPSLGHDSYGRRIGAYLYWEGEGQGSSIAGGVEGV